MRKTFGEKEIPASDASDLSRNEIDEINSASQLWNIFQNEVTSAKQRQRLRLRLSRSRISVVLPSKEVDAEETVTQSLEKLKLRLARVLLRSLVIKSSWIR